MIVVELIGGLGNQLFQYSFGQAIQNYNSSKVIYGLNGINVYKTWPLRINKLIQQFEYTYHYDNYKVISEKSFNFDPCLLSSYSDATCIKGYFQSWKYFNNIASQLKHKISLRSALSENFLYSLANKIYHSNSLMFHVRRGDYVSNLSASELHGVINLDVLKNLVLKLISNNKFDSIFGFGDDAECVQEVLNSLPKNIPLINVCKLNLQDYQELSLMRLFKHVVIANSTFSWWGAYLSEHTDVDVHYPKRWFIGKEIIIGDLIPVTWSEY